MVSLNAAENKWLERYRALLYERYPGLVEDIILYGSKARGDSREDSDIDLMIVIREGDRSVKKKIAYLAYGLAAGTETVPSIIVYTQDERQKRLQENISFMQIVQNEGVSVR